AGLRSACYEPFIETIRATLRHGIGIRVDHILGLFRLFWIPRGDQPEDGAYVEYRADELLAVLAVESHRSNAFVIGEDLGTVEGGIRGRLAADGILSSRVLWFEPELPAQHPELALATISTHDLPTIAGVWTGRELEMQRAVGQRADPRSVERLRERIRTAAGLAADAPVEELIERAHEALGAAPSVLVAASLEDSLAVAEKPNAPGAPVGYPSWRLALPITVEQLRATPLAMAVARAIGRRRSSLTTRSTDRATPHA